MDRPVDRREGLRTGGQAIKRSAALPEPRRRPPRADRCPSGGRLVRLGWVVPGMTVTHTVSPAVVVTSKSSPKARSIHQRCNRTPCGRRLKSARLSGIQRFLQHRRRPPACLHTAPPHAVPPGPVPGRYPISISAGRPSRPIARRWRKCERSAVRSDGCDE